MPSAGAPQGDIALHLPFTGCKRAMGHHMPISCQSIHSVTLHCRSFQPLTLCRTISGRSLGTDIHEPAIAAATAVHLAHGKACQQVSQHCQQQAPSPQSQLTRFLFEKPGVESFLRLASRSLLCSQTCTLPLVRQQTPSNVAVPARKMSGVAATARSSSQSKEHRHLLPRSSPKEHLPWRR